MKKSKTAAEPPAKRKESEEYPAPEVKYYKTKPQLDDAVGRDFIKHANRATEEGEAFLVGLSHGKSPSGAYAYILEHYNELKRPELIRYTFINSKLKRQRGLVGVTDAVFFIKALIHSQHINKDQILGRTLDRDNLEAYAEGLNKQLSEHIIQHNKQGLDYVFVATDPLGGVGGIDRRSIAFQSDAIIMVVESKGERELTFTPQFLKKSRRIAFLATKADKRRPLAWLLSRTGKENESPSFLRYMDNVKKRMTVFVDDDALTWPQIEINRETDHGISTIRIDLPKPYNENAKAKLPVVLLLHGFLGLDSFDGLLTEIPSHKYIAAAMHYGSVPHHLPPVEYSQHIVYNIDAVVNYFGSKGHPVYLFDHSIANIYFLMIDREFNKLPGIKKYLRGRIGANPFFGEEAGHATLGFMDNIILPAKLTARERPIFLATWAIIPWTSKAMVRNRGINITSWLISTESPMRDRIWKAVKQRILYLTGNLDSLPVLNQVPIERALNRLPVKVFAIQLYSALTISKIFDKQTTLQNIPRRIPVLILKSKKDAVAKFVPRLYEKNPGVRIIDITKHEEEDLFREHLFHMTEPRRTTGIIDQFISETEEARKKD
jgi:hypothetical protein